MSAPLLESQQAPVSRIDVEVKTTEQEAWKKYAYYSIEVDETQDDKAKEIQLNSWKRPHMRAFHYSWWGFFISYCMWFVVVPLLPYMQEDLNLTNRDIWNSNIAGVASTILVRLIAGPLCDVYGARILFTIVLCLVSIPTACLGFVQSARGLIIWRVFIGIVGSAIVMCQYWVSRMFTKEIIGTATGLVGGWGNLGAGVMNLVVGSILMPIFTAMFGGDTSKAWRSVSVVPAAVALISGITIYHTSDDAPKGNYRELKKHGQFPPVTVASSCLQGTMNLNTWIMFVQYACCLGVELTMNSASAMYFKDVFGLSTEAALAIGGIFGWLNLFARGLGGVVSDVSHMRWGMRGRLWAQTLFLIAEGLMVFAFANSNTLGGSIVALVVFSLFNKAAQGTSFAIVPYIDPSHMGMAFGIAGAGGNVGAVCFGLAFRDLPYNTAFLIMGCSILGSSTLSIFLNIRGYSGLLWGNDRRVDQETGKLIQNKDRSASSSPRQDASAWAY